MQRNADEKLVMERKGFSCGPCLSRFAESMTGCLTPVLLQPINTMAVNRAAMPVVAMRCRVAVFMTVFFRHCLHLLLALTTSHVLTTTISLGARPGLAPTELPMSTPPQLPASFCASAELAVTLCFMDVCLALCLATLARSRSSMSLTSVSTACATATIVRHNTLAAASRFQTVFSRSSALSLNANLAVRATPRRGRLTSLVVTQFGGLAVQGAALTLRDVLRRHVAAGVGQQAALGIADSHGLTIECAALGLIHVLRIDIALRAADQACFGIAHGHRLAVEGPALFLINAVDAHVRLGLAQ